MFIFGMCRVMTNLRGIGIDCPVCRPFVGEEDIACVKTPAGEAPMTRGYCVALWVGDSPHISVDNQGHLVKHV